MDVTLVEGLKPRVGNIRKEHRRTCAIRPFLITVVSTDANNGQCGDLTGIDPDWNPILLRLCWEMSVGGNADRVIAVVLLRGCGALS